MNRYTYNGFSYRNTENEEINELRQRLMKAEHDLFFLWGFILAQDEYEEAVDFLSEREEDAAPFSTVM